MLTYLILFISTFFSIYHLLSSYKYKDKKILYEVEQNGITILMPCFNEAPILRYTIKGLLDVKYNNLEVIFINDGSTDNTFQTLDELLDLSNWENTNTTLESDKLRGAYKSNKYPFIYIIDKYNSGKADSLNVGIEYSHKELIVTMDGDCVLEKNALINLNKIFVDKDVIASGGVVHIMQMFKLNKKLSTLVSMQALDYIKGFYFYKTSLAYNDALSIISGAFGIFRKSILVEIGGFKNGLGEDIDVTIRFQEYAKNHNKKVVFSREAICYTECPESLGELTKQRIRWQKGFIDAILKNGKFLFKNIFKSNMCFFIMVDALLTNSLATVIFIINIILISAKLIYGYSSSYFIYIYFVNTILFNIICSVLSIKKAKKNIPEIMTKPLYLMILYDVFVFQVLRIGFFFTGTIAYYFNNDSWHKVSRTNNDYKI